MSRHDTRQIRVANSPSSTTTGPFSLIPLTSGVQDWTWVNDDHGWALVRRPCGKTVCVGLRETVDGGRTWTSLPAPDALDTRAQTDRSASCTARPCLSSVRFATPKIGWLFGPALFQTKDGGHTWTRIPGEPVLVVEAANGLAMRVTTTDRTYRDCWRGCNYRIDRMQLGSSSWERLPPVPNRLPACSCKEPTPTTSTRRTGPGAGQTQLGLLERQRRDVDRGRRPLLPPDNGCRTASASAAPGGVLVVLCVSLEDSYASVQISTNRGKTFGPRFAVPGGRVDNAPVAAASAETIAVAYRDQQNHGVLVTHDGGLTWRPTLVRVSTRAENGYNSSLGWEDARTARVSFNTKFIWTTRDGGRSWTRNRVTP